MGGGGGGFGLLSLSAFLPSVMSSFLPKIRRGWGGGGREGARAPALDPPLDIKVGVSAFTLHRRAIWSPRK